ncbi:MAG: DHH family phosphoesterase [Acidobacteriota bacterium]
MADQSALKQIVDKIKDSSNILITVNTNPSVDELSAALAITLFINKLNKHATAVFSGQVPPAIEFLQPEKTFENTVDSLRDFIIALDKEKADHLRYKVVDDMVKIFITPYRTTISEKDLEFSQGDYNVEVVLAVGVQNESDLDRALESHGRILHDATVAAISLGEPTKLGGIEWNDASASSYGELLFQIADGLKSDKGALDEQIATAFLTSIVAATERFSNAKTTSKAMTIAAQLMSAGANQQLIATKLEDEQELPQSAPSESIRASSNGDGAPIVEDKTPEKETAKKDDAIGALSISHEPKGDVDEVAREVAAKQSDQALGKAEEELAKQTAEVAAEKQEDATEAAEQKLAEQLAATAPASPPAVDITADIPMAAPSSLPPLGNVALPDKEMAEPSLGGTLNATTEQAADDKRREIEDDKNRTILSHGGGQYAAAPPMMQSPLNATVASSQAEPEVRDIFADPATDSEPTGHAATIQPPMPESAHAQTLAEIDAQNRTAHDDARAAIDAALGGAPTPTNPPVIGGAPETAPSLPPLPPLPPMPDFSTLPPLPGEAATPAAPAETVSVPDALGDMFPPATPAPEAPTVSNDPAQFKIPGQ